MADQVDTPLGALQRLTLDVLLVDTGVDVEDEPRQGVDRVVGGPVLGPAREALGEFLVGLAHGLLLRR